MPEELWEMAGKKEEEAMPGEKKEREEQQGAKEEKSPEENDDSGKKLDEAAKKAETKLEKGKDPRVRRRRLLAFVIGAIGIIIITAVLFSTLSNRGLPEGEEEGGDIPAGDQAGAGGGDSPETGPAGAGETTTSTTTEAPSTTTVTTTTTTTTQPTCVDTDGGINREVKGTVTYYTEDYTETRVFTDLCVGNETLIENFCRDGRKRDYDYSCAEFGKVCSDGACV